MASENVDKKRADIKKGVADLEKKAAYIKADAEAAIEKGKANLGPSGLEKKVEYVKADLKAGAKKVEAEIKNVSAKADADAEKAKADRERK